MNKEEKNVILLNNLFNGKYIKEKVGGEIINMYKSDNNEYYIYVNPYGNIGSKWDNRIKYILFIRSVGNGVVKVIGKAKIKEQISCNAVRKTGAGIDTYQKQYIDNNKIEYGGVKLYELGSWSNFFVTFRAEGIYKPRKDLYLTHNKNIYNSNTLILENIKKINNQSQKLYIESGSPNYKKIENIINNSDFWETDGVDKVNLSESNENTKSLLSIIKKENDELVNSNLLAYFLETNKDFWSRFVKEVLNISDENIINGTPNIIRESIANIDLFIEVGGSAIVIENKIKSGISSRKNDGYSQLEKYADEAEKYFKGDLYFYLLRPDYNNEDYSSFNKSSKYIEIKYSQINKIIEELNYDFYFEEFKKVVKKHSKEYDNELFEMMNKRFIEQIKEQKARNACR